MTQRTSRRQWPAIVTGFALAAGCLTLLPQPARALTPAAARALTPAVLSYGSATARQSDFEAAAAEFHVPLPVLLGVAHQESLWDAHAGAYNTGGGYGPMNLTDVTPEMVADGAPGAAGRGDLGALAADPALHTLTAAAKLAGAPASRLREGGRDNIRGGAALLASYQQALTGGRTPEDPAHWYGAVARYSGSPDEKAAGIFADGVYATLRSGADRRTADGQRVRLAAEPAVRPDTAQLSRLGLRTAVAAQTECPATVDCVFLAAAASNGQVANRPTDGMDVDYLVIHDTESSYESAIATFQKAGGSAAHYVMRASDGAVTQMLPGKDIGFHAGNYWFNMHSIGIEHEGFAAQGAGWYTETQYRATADLVRYLAERYDIPLDRQHVLGHDNVPGPQSSSVSGMHWDPGPYWDWSHFMEMLNSATPQGPSGGGQVGPVGSAVTITPTFADNSQTVGVCPSDDPTGDTTACTDKTAPSNFLYVRTEPRADAPLFGDQALHPGAAGTDRVNDWGSKVSAGQQFVVAGSSGDWTAIWFSGQKVWFLNPGGKNTTPATGVQVIKPAGTSAAPVFGQGYPQPSEYPSGLNPSRQAPLDIYSLPAGQAYVSTQPPVHTDDFFVTGDTVVKGAGSVYTIQYNYRVALVNASDVT
ncbi:N-acetylmuramoyl-L-alanine amidase [Streptomyces sp. NPDC088725]|uniref:N-acetylmuramoyl-L-alanine amidase n=1 Tax=Streptomyces sp. NPDC088725 TaxID=3365873 RepID=UPI003830C48C